MNDEIQPYLVYRIVGNQMECALWQFQEGERALALFLSGDSATTYRDAAKLDGDWKVFCPAKEVLLQLFQMSYQAGIRRAVLDPDLEKAKRIFSIYDILRATRP